MLESVKDDNEKARQFFKYRDNETEQESHQSLPPPALNTQGNSAELELIQKIEGSHKPNNTGIPDDMKTNFEGLSGFSFDDVKVHYNSDKPAQLQALAYTQGNQVYVGPGQEEHLGHELGHVVQQKEGRVKPTINLNGFNVNDDDSLEKEAGNYTTIQCKQVIAPNQDTISEYRSNTIQLYTEEDIVKKAREIWQSKAPQESYEQGQEKYRREAEKILKIEERAYYLWVQKGRPEQTKEQRELDYIRAEYEQLQSERYDKNVQNGKLGKEPELVSYPIRINYGKGVQKTLIVSGENNEDFNIALSEAIVIWVSEGIIIPDNLEISFYSNDKVSEEAFHFGSGKIVMTPIMFGFPKLVPGSEKIIKGGKASDGIAGVGNQIARGDKIRHGASIITHELGHVLHRLEDPDNFVKLQRDHPKDPGIFKAASKVSDYAVNGAQHSFELIAEVFTGLTYGIDYEASVINQYLKYKGSKEIVRKRYPYLFS